MTHHISGVELHADDYPCSSHYPFSLPLFRQTREVRFNRPVTFFVGENGTGKSTLLEAVARTCGVHIWRTEEGVRYKPNHYEKQLHRYISVRWVNGVIPGAYFGSEMFSDFRSIVENWAACDPGQLDYFGGKSLITQSHGQSMMSYFESRYKREGIYFLDEPETALSPQSQLRLIDLVQENAQYGHAQFIIATHSPILLGTENAQIYSFDHDSIQETAYRETAHYRIYKEFLANR